MPGPGYTEEQLKRALGGVLSEWRVKRRLSQEFVADAIGMSRQHLTRLEGGHHGAGPYLLARLAALYGLPLAQLIRQAERRARDYASRAL